MLFPWQNGEPVYELAGQSELDEHVMLCVEHAPFEHVWPVVQAWYKEPCTPHESKLYTEFPTHCFVVFGVQEDATKAEQLEILLSIPSLT